MPVRDPTTTLYGRYNLEGQDLYDLTLPELKRIFRVEKIGRTAYFRGCFSDSFSMKTISTSIAVNAVKCFIGDSYILITHGMDINIQCSLKS